VAHPAEVHLSSCWEAEKSWRGAVVCVEQSSRVVIVEQGNSGKETRVWPFEMVLTISRRTASSDVLPTRLGMTGNDSTHLARHARQHAAWSDRDKT
jgi:hypothetical protein